jgi:hypothetical protein
MKYLLSFLLFLLCLQLSFAQDSIPAVKIDEQIVAAVQDTLLLPSDSLTQTPDSILQQDKTAKLMPVAATIDTTQKINYWRITERTGEILPVRPDTFLTDYFNRTNVEGLGVSIAYLGNSGLPLESRVFFEREDRSDFLFSDNLRAYLKQPDKFNFINTKIPCTNISYQSAGSSANKEERFQALLALNIGKKLNIGTFVDYLYARGFYNSQGTKHTDWVFFGNYLSDRHQVHLFINPASSYTNGENGGLQDDNYITHPELVSSRNMQSRNFPTQISNTWNTTSGNRFFLNYHYNLGFERGTQQKDSAGNEIMQFIPVSSIIYTFDYTNRKRKFYTQDSTSLNRFYSYADNLNPDRIIGMASDSTSYHSIKNTFGLSLREGFSQWAKFDLTAYISQDVRQFTLMDTTVILSAIANDTLHFASSVTNQYATCIGGELAKRTGKILRYNAQGSIGVVGYNVGDIHLSGSIEARIPFLKDTASVSATGYIKDVSPTFYENHYHSQYFWWDESFSKTKKVYIGGKIIMPFTRTEGSFGVENITDYIYFDGTGYPKQYGGNIQVLAVSLQQNFKLGGLHWDNQAVYQTSSNQTILPLPTVSAYSSLFLQFVISKVLTVQMGANAHYWTRYYSPTYEPATQQFRLQQEDDLKKKVGEYPLISGFLNCHLKQTRFFLQYYNLGAMFISPPEYFSIPHYPVNPPVLRLGLSVDFIN